MQKIKFLMMMYCLILVVVPQVLSQNVTIRIATIVPEGSSWVKCIKDIDQECRQKIGVRFILYAGGVAGENQAMIQKIKYGQLEGAGLSGFALADFSSRIRIMDMPFMYNSLEEWKYVFKKIRSDIEDDLDKSGYVVLGWTYSGMAYIYSRDPVHNVQEFRDAKPWIYPGDPLMEDAFRELQANGVPLGTSGVLPAIQTGMVRCVYNSPYGLLAVQWHTSMSHWTDAPIGNTIGAFVITKSAFQRIPAIYQNKFKEICRNHFRTLSEQIDQDNTTAAQELAEKYNIKKIAPESAWVAELAKFGEQISRRQIGKLYAQDFYDKVVKYQQEFRSKKQ